MNLLKRVMVGLVVVAVCYVGLVVVGGLILLAMFMSSGGAK